MTDEDTQAIDDHSNFRKSMEILINFQWKIFVQTFDALTRGLTFYFLIVATSIGLTFQAKLQGGELKAVIIVVITVTALVTCIFLVFAFVLVRAFSRLGNSLRRLSEDLFDELDMTSYFKKARSAALVVTCMCVLLLVVISLATISMLWR